MRHTFVIAVLAFCHGCTTTADSFVRPACDTRSTCFNERSVRNYQLLDDRTLLVQVGANRCPYLVELDGFGCNLGFATGIAFRDSDGRICSVDNSFIIGGPFISEFDDLCQIRDVRAITDDELLERFATAGRIPPLPPVGSGELQVENAEDPENVSGSESVNENPPEGRSSEGND